MLRSFIIFFTTGLAEVEVVASANPFSRLLTLFCRHSPNNYCNNNLGISASGARSVKSLNCFAVVTTNNNINTYMQGVYSLVTWPMGLFAAEHGVRMEQCFRRRELRSARIGLLPIAVVNVANSSARRPSPPKPGGGNAEGPTAGMHGRANRSGLVLLECQDNGTRW